MKWQLPFRCLVLCSVAWAQQDESRPVSLYFSYTAEGFTNGADARYLGSLVAGFRLDLHSLRLGRGTIFAGAQQLHGRGMNSRLGALQAPSNLDAETSGRIGEVWYADEYLAGKLRIKAGRQYADSEFGSIDSAADFLNAAYGVVPTAPMPTYRNPSWAPVRRLRRRSGFPRAPACTAAASQSWKPDSRRRIRRSAAPEDGGMPRTTAPMP
jgi:carbohydrate-selective porin OprB